ncbi:hypothetical protein D3C71_1894680 [compost metagenome]
MLKNLWYVVLPSSQLSEELASVRLLGQPFVAFRDNKGKAHLLSDGGTAPSAIENGY